MKPYLTLKECLLLVHHGLQILSNRPCLNTTKLTKQAEKPVRGDQGKEEKSTLQLRKRHLLCASGQNGEVQAVWKPDADPQVLAVDSEVWS